MLKFSVNIIVLILILNITSGLPQKKLKVHSDSNKVKKEVETSTTVETLKVDEEEKTNEKKESIEESETEAESEADKDEKNEENESKDKGEEAKDKEKPSEVKEDEENEAEGAPTQETSETEDKNEIVSSGLPMVVTVATTEKETPPENTFAVWNSKGKICLLAKFDAVFAIKYPSSDGEQKAEINLPENAVAKGKCESEDHQPSLQLSWHKCSATFFFNKTETDNSVVTSMDFTYDTSHSLFDRATNAGKITVKSKPSYLFETPLDKSYYCPAQEVVLLYDGEKHVVTARIKDIYMQAYNVEEGEFSQPHRCDKVVIDGPDAPFIQDETVPLAVGCTLALITLIVLVGGSIHRAITAAKADYNAVP